MQLGKWRRRITLPRVSRRAPTTRTTRRRSTTRGVDKTTESLLRLPKKQLEGSPDDNIPLIAMVTGSCDYAECFLANTIGIDRQEFGGTTSDQARSTCTAATTPSSKQLPAGTGTGVGLWGNYAEIAKYDIIFGACECSDYDRTSAGYTNMEKYLRHGGRMFGTHYYYNFFALPDGPGRLQQRRHVEHRRLRQRPAAVLRRPGLPQGQGHGVVALQREGHHDARAASTTSTTSATTSTQIVTPKATRWLYSGQQSGNTYKTLYMSFNTPVNKPVVDQCGRAVFSDVHLSGSSYSTYTSQSFPQWCGSRSAGSGYENNEAALEFLFFDLASCVQDDQKPPVVPPPN